MGVSWHVAKGLVGLRAGGATFGKTLTLGRLNLFAKKPDVLSFLRLYDLELGLSDRESFLADGSGFAEPFFRLLGASTVDSMDNSTYEGATIRHDLNLPVGDELVGQYDVVIDGGTLEHVFNYPVGLKNAMSMVRTGGKLAIFTPANNFMGHGFYSFSPELFFRALTEENGYRVDRIVVAEYYPGSQWFEVRDPDEVHSRVSLVNDGLQVLMHVYATKLEEVDAFAAWPQQSDYVTAWNSTEIKGEVDPASTYEKPSGIVTRLDRRIKRALAIPRPRKDPESRQSVRQKNLAAMSLGSQPRFYIPVDK